MSNFRDHGAPPAATTKRGYTDTEARRAALAAASWTVRTYPDAHDPRAGWELGDLMDMLGLRNNREG